MAKFKIMMTCYDADPSVNPYEDWLSQFYQTREEAQRVIGKLVEDELETLNDGEAEGEFVGNFDSEQHEAVVEFWEGEPTENDRDMRPVTVYDIVEVAE